MASGFPIGQKGSFLGANSAARNSMGTPTPLTHWGWVTHICISKLTTIGSYNGSLPGWHQAIIWINVEILLIQTWGTNFCKILSNVCALVYFHSRKCIYRLRDGASSSQSFLIEGWYIWILLRLVLFVYQWKQKCGNYLKIQRFLSK